MGAIPLGMLAVIAIAGRWFRRQLESSMELSEAAAEEQPLPVVAAIIPELQLIRIDASEVIADEEAMKGISEARKARVDLGVAFIAAALAYTAVSTGTLIVGMVSLHSFKVDVPVAMIYMLQWVPLVIVLWVVELPWRLRVGALTAYLLLGLLLAVFASSWAHAFHLFTVSMDVTVLIPSAAVVPLLIRRLRPWLLALLAILAFVVSGTWALLLSKLGTNPGTVRLRFYILGAAYAVSAVVLVLCMLRSKRWRLSAALLAALTLAGILFLLLHRPGIGIELLALPSYVIQMLLVWAIFKGFVKLQEKQLLPVQVLHSHLCWGALTLYMLSVSGAGKLYGYLWWKPWAIALAYCLYLLVLHLVLHRLWQNRAARQGQRLLLLRVFGKADKRERLLDWLDNTWRFIGRIDLIAGTDLAERTLGARMLEAFLLRRTDQMFLRTPEDVDKRLANLHSQLEGDARYPVNSVYCYASAWREAVGRLAPESDAVLMDLRGFSVTNQGCIFELTWIVQRLRLSKIVLLTDASTDFLTLEATLREAWSKLPASSPSAKDQAAKLTVAEVKRRGSAERGLFALLLNAAAPAPSQASVAG